MPTATRRRAAVLAVAAAPFALGLTALPAQAHANHEVRATLSPLKGSQASGTVTLTPTSDGGLKVHITDTGMTPGMPHAQHIHGDVSGKHFFCPSASADKNGDGYISVEEGLPMYGGIHISLTTKGDTSMKSALAVDRMPVADKNGNIDYTRTLTADELPDGTLAHLDDLHVVQHGIDANGNNKYDLDGLGESTFAASLGVKGIPEEATDGATCGMISPHGGVNTGGADHADATPTALGGVAALAVLGTAASLIIRRRTRLQHTNS